MQGEGEDSSSPGRQRRKISFMISTGRVVNGCGLRALLAVKSRRDAVEIVLNSLLVAGATVLMNWKGVRWGYLCIPQ